MSRLGEIVRRREALQARITAERARVAIGIARLDSPLTRAADTGFRIARVLRAHPVLLALGAALLVSTRRHRLLMWSGRFFTLWEIYRIVRPLSVRGRIEPGDHSA